MADIDVIVLMGQSNAEGEAIITDLPASYRGPQNARIFNFENNNITVINVDGVGPNLPNNTTLHTAGVHGMELSLGETAFQAGWNPVFFKYSVPSSSLGPNPVFDVWHPFSLDLYSLFLVRWAAFKALVAGAGDSIRRIKVVWYQGETDSISEGNDIAYYGNFQFFKRQIRTDLSAGISTLIEPVRWVTCLIHRALVPPGLGSLLQTINNIRGAQLRSGWDDSEYRIVDTDRVSFKTDLFHVDSPGQVQLGLLVWEAVNLATSNCMALEQYDLLSLRTRLAEEFGVDLNVPENVQIINKRINDAISWIVSRRKNWPWLERIVSLDVGEVSTSISAARFGAAVFTKAQRQAILGTFNPSLIQAREIIDFNGDGRYGILCASLSGTTLELRQSYKEDSRVCPILSIVTGATTRIIINPVSTEGAAVIIPSNVTQFGVVITGTSHLTPAGTFNGNWIATRVNDREFTIPLNSIGFTAITFGLAQIAREFRIAQAYFELPADFIRNFVAHLDSDVENNTLDYVHPSLWEREIRADRIQTNLTRIYSTVVDPLNIGPNKYLVVYPYFLDRNTIHLRYWGDAKKLIADLDEPDVPRSDRYVVWCAAAWFVAQWQKDTTMADFHRAAALQAIQDMAAEYQLSDDTTESVPRGSDDMGPIRGPDSYPEFDMP